MPSNSSSKRPNICHHILSTMVRHSPLGLLTTDTLQQELSRMLSVGMQLKPDTLFLEDLDGIVMDYLLNTKLIKNLKSLTKRKFLIWESRNIIKLAEVSS